LDKKKFFPKEKDNRFFKENLKNLTKDGVLRKIIIEGNTRVLVEKSEKLGEYLAMDVKESQDDKPQKEQLTTSQIRKFFGTVKKIEARGELDDEGIRQLLLLKPKLAYAAKRAHKTKLPTLKEVLTDSIELVTSDEGVTQEKFNNFCNLFESILCYHKASGGKN
jgi:CRISPR-associated protein Csm2